MISNKIDAFLVLYTTVVFVVLGLLGSFLAIKEGAWFVVSMMMVVGLIAFWRSRALPIEAWHILIGKSKPRY